VTDFTFVDMQSLTSDFLAAFGTNFAPVMSDNLEIHSAEAVFFWTGGPTHVFADGFVEGTETAGTALPASAAVGISWRQPVSYRGGHPRTYLCGFQSDILADVTRLSGSAQLAISNAANGFLTDVEDLGPYASLGAVKLGTVSYITDGDWRPNPLFFHYQSASVDLRLDTQRRRLGRDIAG